MYVEVQERVMKAVYDPRTDTLTLELKPGPVAESDEGKPSVILDYDEAGNLVGIEILDASVRVAEARSMQFGRARTGSNLGEVQTLF